MKRKDANNEYLVTWYSDSECIVLLRIVVATIHPHDFTTALALATRIASKLDSYHGATSVRIVETVCFDSIANNNAPDDTDTEV